MRKLVVVSIITILSVYGFSMAVSVGIGFNLDMSSGALVTPVFIQFSAGIPYLQGTIHAYVFSFDWSSLVVKGFSLPDHTYLGIQTKITVHKSIYVKGQIFWSLKHITSLIGGERTMAGTPLYTRIGLGSNVSSIGLDAGFDGYWQLEPSSTVPFARPYLLVNFTF
ncbi:MULTISPECIES: hypothetical protein [Mesotoga]|uniref:hypothetical protein n=1 Tax=Mesotoga TaxID=1184396 RepID=UPI0002CB5286|nr:MULTISPECIES: hypothetical protein [Mesotoga]MCP5457919.1 hypothetical protein [Thermotogota bacterium]CCU85889.1 conserved exported hypothetical protein [Mesotoga infera]MCB1222414.1 hypothetical protein [Mesotoga sp.]PIJ62149.1 hypothetical protein V513_05955 [Mesotoga sp. H07.pep.5.3]RLL87707.1 hypothetical protein Y696_08140 [Mesotoga sp. H07pep.5.4]